MRTRILYFFLILTPHFFVSALQAQEEGETKVWQLSGLVVSQDSMTPIPFARIMAKTHRRYSVADANGFYSIPVVEDDTLYFYALGYRPSMFIVRNYLSDYKGDKESNYLYTINYLDEDPITLQTVTIFPYRNPGEIKAAILETNAPESIESINARQNLDPDALDILIKNMEVDEGERIMVARQLYYNQHQTRNIAPTIPLFDAVAVYRLLDYINQRAKTKKREGLDTWLEN